MRHVDHGGESIASQIDHSVINASWLFCLKRQTRYPVPKERRSLFLPVLKFTQKVRSAGFQALFRIFCNPSPCFSRKSPCFWPINRETGSYLTAHTTIQSPQTARFQYEVKSGLSAGIFGRLFPVFFVSAGHDVFYWRFLASVSAPKNSVPGSRGLSSKVDRTELPIWPLVTLWQTTFDRGAHEVWCEERERDRHVDLTHAALLT